jgi:hypothetical protein
VSVENFGEQTLCVAAEDEYGEITSSIKCILGGQNERWIKVFHSCIQ